MPYSPNGSPIMARQNAPVFIIIIVLLLIAALIFLIWLLSKQISNYYNSEEYLEKERTRPTNAKDIKKLKEKFKIPKEEAALLMELCNRQNIPNLSFIIKDNTQVQEIFKNAYFDLIKSNASQDKINLFFKLNYTLELISAQTKKYISTRQIPLSTVVFYISEEGEQYPFNLIANTKDCFALEIPKFFYNLKTKPDILVRIKFTFKSQNGLSHNFVTRIMRYQENPDGNATMYVAHSENLITETHRHFKREMFDDICYFSSAQKVLDKSGNITYKISEKKYKGSLSNISGGGCCIKTNLPIAEKQNLAVIFPNITSESHILGKIKGTRKLPAGLFALHIQFIDISIEAQNKILAYVYKYKL